MEAFNSQRYPPKLFILSQGQTLHAKLALNLKRIPIQFLGEKYFITIFRIFVN